jgi:hypothetical protein
VHFSRIGSVPKNHPISVWIFPLYPTGFIRHLRWPKNWAVRQKQKTPRENPGPQVSPHSCRVLRTWSTACGRCSPFPWPKPAAGSPRWRSKLRAPLRWRRRPRGSIGPSCPGDPVGESKWGVRWFESQKTWRKIEGFGIKLKNLSYDDLAIKHW